MYSNITSIAFPKIVLDAAVRLEPGSQVQCSAVGVLPIFIALIRNFTVLMNTTNTANSKLYQEGNYTCVATNKYGTDVKHFVIEGKKIRFDTHLCWIITDIGKGIHIPTPKKGESVLHGLFVIIAFLICSHEEFKIHHKTLRHSLTL